MGKLCSNVTQDNLNEQASIFISKLEELANQAGGEAPKPERPNTEFINELKLQTGNTLLLSLFYQAASIGQAIKEWGTLAEKIGKRWSQWVLLQNLAEHAASLDQDNVFLAQVSMIEQQRQLLVDPDLIEPLIKNLTQLLRDELNTLEQRWDRAWNKGEEVLASDENWNKLQPDQKHNLRLTRQLLEKAKPQFAVQDSESIIKTLDTIGLEGLRDRIAAMNGRYAEILVESARLMEPETQFITVKKPTLRTSDDVDTWLEELRVALNRAVEKGPVVVR